MATEDWVHGGWSKCYGEKDNLARVILYILQCGPITQLIFLTFSTIDIPNSFVWARNGMPLVSWKYDLCWCHTVSGIILYMCQANERWCYTGLWCKKTEQYQIAIMQRDFRLQYISLCSEIDLISFILALLTIFIKHLYTNIMHYIQMWYNLLENTCKLQTENMLKDIVHRVNELQSSQKPAV